MQPARKSHVNPWLMFVAKRAASAVVLVLVVSAVSFLLISVAPGDPARQILGSEASAEAVEALRNQLGLDDPVYVQYLDWLSGAVTGDLGVSIYSSEPVGNMLGSRAWVTLSLVLLSLGLSVVIGVLIGFVSAVRGGVLGRILDSAAMLGYALPSFWLGAVLISLFAVTLGWLPATGYVPFGESPIDWARTLILPVIALATHSIAAIAKQTREVLLEILASEHIRMAYANGISRRSLLLRHAMKNAGIRILAVLTVLTIGLMGGTVMVEYVFAMPGLGGLAVEASLRKDLPALQGVVVLVTVVVVVINLLADIANSWLNPKVVSE